MLCRLCLMELSPNFITIFKDDGEILEAEILKNIVKYLEIELQFCDEISNKICVKCWKQLEDFQKFCLDIREKQVILEAELTSKMVTIEECGEMKMDSNLLDEEEVEDNLFIEPSIDVLQVKKESLNNDKECFINGYDNNNDNDNLNEDDNENDNDNANDNDSSEGYMQDLSSDSDSSISLKLSLRSKTVNMTKKSNRKPNLKRSRRRLIRKRTKSLENDSTKALKKAKLKEENEEIEKFIKEHIELICNICKQKLETFSSLKIHYRKEHNCTGYMECCNTRFKKRFLLVDHIKVHSDPHHFKCKLCDKVLISRNSYNNHMDTIHPPEDKLKFDCNLCSKKFTKQYILDVHMTLQHRKTEEIQCETCKKIFKSQLSLRQHITNIHLNVSSIICDLCGLVLKSKQNLKYHMSAIHNIGQIHQQVQCTLCGNWLANDRSLQKHMNRHRDEASEKIFTCHICGENKSTRVKLASHIRYHHNDKSFKCTLCDKQLKSQISLNEHMATHTGKDLYTCPFCPRTFKSHANLHNHKKKLHSDQMPPKNSKPFQPNLKESSLSNNVNDVHN